MARKNMSLEDAMEKYKGGGNNASYFSLKNDKDTATVRFMHTDIDDAWNVVHKVEIDGKDRWVLCTQEGDCPGCKKLSKPQLKLFLQLEQDGERKLWERGQNFIPKIQGLINRYGDLCNREYEIERNGKAGDTKTTYELYALDKDDYTIDEIEEEFNIEKQDLIGAFILDLSFEDFEDAVHGDYKLPKREEEDKGSRRRTTRDDDAPKSRRRGRELDEDAPAERRSRRSKDEDDKEDEPKEERSSRRNRSEDKEEPKEERPRRGSRSEDKTEEEPRRRRGSSEDGESRSSGRRSGSNVF